MEEILHLLNYLFILNTETFWLYPSHPTGGVVYIRASKNPGNHGGENF